MHLMYNKIKCSDIKFTSLGREPSCVMQPFFMGTNPLLYKKEEFSQMTSHIWVLP